MSVFDLRQWLADAESAGELEDVRGADAVLEIGAASRPHERLADFPAVAEASDDLLRRVAQRWPELAR